MARSPAGRDSEGDRRSVSRSLSPDNGRGRSRSRSRSLSRSPYRSRSRSPYRSKSRSWSRSRSRSYSRSPRSHEDAPSWDRRPQEQPPSTIYVGNLPDHTTPTDLEDYFETFGLITNVKLIYDHETQAFRHFAFVTFDRPDDADRAVREANGVELLGNRIRCNIAKYNRPPGMRGAPAPRQMRSSGGRGYRRYDDNSPRRRSLSPPPPRRRSSYSMDRSLSPVGRNAAKRSPSVDPSPPRTKRAKPLKARAASPDSPRSLSSGSESPGRDRGHGAAGADAAAKARLERELEETKQEKAKLLGELETARESLAQQTDVIEKIRAHAQSRRVQMKALTLRSQKRGQFLLSMAEASEKVSKCKDAVKAANDALTAAQEELERITSAAEAYIKDEEEQRQAEEARGEERKASDRRKGDKPSGGVAEPAKNSAGEVAAGSSQAAAEPSNGLGFKLKPFRVQM